MDAWDQDERRRSTRVPVSLPVWLKDAQGGERTETLDVSAHGMLVRTDRLRAARQYLELEVTLPSAERVALTAMVARAVPEFGAALDFFTLESDAKGRWQNFLKAAAEGEERLAPSPSSSSLSEVEVAVDLDGLSDAPEPRAPPRAPSAPAPTFMVKPRDLGRLWAFYRGELARCALRLESPVRTELGLRVEILVVHPRSGEEWPFQGEVVRCEAGRGGQLLLDVALVGIDTRARAEFRSFVSTGQVAPHFEEEVSGEERLPSVMVDLDDLELESTDNQRPPALEDLELEVTDNQRPPALEDPELEVTDNQRSPAAPLALDQDASEEETVVSDPPRNPSVVPTAAPPSVVSPPPPPRMGEVIPSGATQVPPTSLFASFFAEAAAAEQASAPAPVPVTLGVAEVPSKDSPPEPEDVRATPPESSKSSETPSMVRRRLEVSGSGLRIHPLPRSVPPPPARASGPGSVVVTAAPLEALGAAPERKGGLREVTPPPATPGTFFELEDSPPELSLPAVSPEPQIELRPLPRSAPKPRRRVADEKFSAGPTPHQPMSTAGTNPGLDRDIALARAKLVRSPTDPQAARRLAEMLFERGRRDQLEDAIVAYERCLTLAPDDWTPHLRIAELHARAGRYARARDHLKVAESRGQTVDPDLARIVELGARS